MNLFLPADLDRTIDTAWQRARGIPGFIADNELRFLGLLAATCAVPGVIVEIGSFKGKSTVMLATVASKVRGGGNGRH